MIIVENCIFLLFSKFFWDICKVIWYHEKLDKSYIFWHIEFPLSGFIDYVCNLMHPVVVHGLIEVYLYDTRIIKSKKVF